MLAQLIAVHDNEDMTVAILQELLERATAIEDAAIRASEISRVRSSDIQLVAVKESASALRQRITELAADEARATAGVC